MLAIPMTAKGVEIRPLRQMTGESEFNEVFLDEVEVPVEHLIGPENEGWRVAEHDAGQRAGRLVRLEGAGAPPDRDRSLVAGVSTHRAACDDPLARQRLATSWIDVEIFRLHNQRTLDATRRAGRRSVRSRASSSCSGQE